jgi:hypothetical protein
MELSRLKPPMVRQALYIRRVIRPEKVISRAVKCETDFLRRTDRQTIVVAHTLGPRNIFFFFSFSGTVVHKRRMVQFNAL